MKFGGLSAPVSFILRNFSSRPYIPLLRITSFFKPMNVSFSRVRQPSFPFFSPDLGQPRPSWERAAASHASYSRREAATIRRFDAPTWPKRKKPVSSWALPFLLYPRFLHRAALENAHGYLSLFFYLSFYMAFFLPLFCRLVSVFLVFARGARDVTAWANTREPVWFSVTRFISRVRRTVFHYLLLTPNS